MTYEPCSGSSVGSPLTKAFFWGRSNTIWVALMVSRPAELRSCLIESAHLVLGAASRSPAMDVWVEVIESSSREGGWHAVEMSKPAKAALS